MAKIDNLAKVLVHDTFRPRVAVLCSPSAQALCEKNNLQFTQLIQPFCSLTTDLSWQEPYGQYIAPRGLCIHPVDLSTWKPPDNDSQKNRRILGNIVGQSLPPFPGITEDPSDQVFQKLHLNGRSYNYSLQVPQLTPWFESWRETFLKFYSEQQQSQHEFLNQFVACVLVIAAYEIKSPEDVSNILGKLSKLQLQHQQEWSHTWFFPAATLKFYLILHDNANDNITNSEGCYQSLRTTYGGNFCYMLRINSAGLESDEEIVSDVWSPYIQKENQIRRDILNSETLTVFEDIEPVNVDEPFHPLSPASEYPPSIPPANGEFSANNNENFLIRGKCFTQKDMQNVQIAVNEFIGKSLLPYVERQAKVMHESILNRRGVSKSFFSATKRLFGTGAKTASSIVYALESPEMITRKLADLYFLFGHYDGAYQLYHQIKKDFQADAAWVYYASSIELAALSHFMMTQSDPPMAVTRSFPVHYINEAISHYNDLCRMPEAAHRCAIIFCECLKHMGNFGEAAAIFIRMTSEDCDLRSALMLEQAAYTFIKLNSPRKYALHSVLAGHRYAKAGLRSHSLNCYLQAFQIYGGRGWKFAEDHVQFTIARHQASLQIYKGLMERLLSLLKTPTLQSAAQIQMFYKEFISAAGKLFEVDRTPRENVIPNVRSSGIRIVIASTGLPTGEILNYQLDPDSVEVSHWDSLEEQVLKESIDPSVIMFRPSRLIFDARTDNTVHPNVPCNETFYVEIPFYNPLSTEVSLRRIALKFDDTEAVESSVVDSMTLQSEEIKTLRFGASSSVRGMISFDYVSYELELGSVCVPFVQKIILKGPRLNSTKEERSGIVYAKDLRNKINVVGKMPLLQAEVENLPPALYHSQCTDFNLVLTDKTSDTTQKLRVSRVVLASENMNSCLEIRPSVASGSTGDLVLESVQKNYCPFAVTFDGSSSIRIPCLYKVPPLGDVATLNMLILYEIKPENEDPVVFSAFGTVIYRVIKISIKIPLLTSLRFDHSFLKKADILTAINLLRIQNLSKGRTVVIEGITFDTDAITIEEKTWQSSSNKDYSTLTLEPAQSCNVIFRTKLATNNFQSTDNQDFILCVDWKILQEPLQDNSANVSGTTVKGFHRLNIQRADILCNRDQSPILFQLRHLSRNKHDFNRIPCFIFPVELEFNCQKSGRFIVKIENDLKRTIEPDTQSLHTASSQAVYFIGKTSWTINAEALRSEKLIYNVALTRPGIYNIAPTVSVKTPEDGIHQTFELHSPFIIDQE
ncbi:unnamed protein product [Allacma fusca]|uniref:Trafficking protein particle complex subunit 8 n=1 Tax=Allacma fusca TaxID=39272 RepID=A0A8J2J6N1_9HEXA|nr:unnamed protein product [Allacma fusca]